VKKKLSIVLAVVLTVSLLLTSGAFAGGGEKEVIPAQMVLDASLSEVSAAFETPKANLEVATSRAFNFGVDKFLLSSIVDKKSKQAYMVSTDAQGKVWIAEPKIEGELVDYMSQMKPGETVVVDIWAIYVSPEEELQQIPSKYPDVTFEGTRPALEADVSPEVLDAIEADVTEIKLRANKEAVQPVVDFLQSTGGTILYISKYAPTVDAELSKEDVYKLARLPEVKSISLPPEVIEPCMDVAAQTIRANDVWAEGYDGGGNDGSAMWPDYYQSKVAVIDSGVDWRHPCLEHAYWGQTKEWKDHLPWAYHGTMVAGCLASIHEVYRGIAYGTAILDGNFASLIGTSWSYLKSACEWAHDNGADVYNLSWNLRDDGSWDNAYCEYFDSIAYVWDRLPVCAAGNSENTEYVVSPANAWNVLAVGGIYDRGTADWADDIMYSDSSWINPETPHSDREKPEVCAPADWIKTTIAGTSEVPPDSDSFGSRSGTSLAAPQVAGIAALLIEKNYSLKNYPALLKAIIMASANHNVEPNPSPDRPVDDKEGVGTVNAKAAFDCVDEGWTWSGDKVEADLPFDIPFYAEEGETVRFVISWYAHADYYGSGDYGLCADLGLDIIGGPLYPWWYTWYGGSDSYDSAWEIVEFTAPYTGNYYARVYAYDHGAGDPWTCTGAESIAAAWYRWTPPEATTLELLPETDSNTVGTYHQLTATVYDQIGCEMEDIAVTWSISGVGSFSGTPGGVTDANGRAYAWITSSLPGTSTVTCEVTGNPSVSDTATNDWTYTPEATALELLPGTGENPVDTTHDLTATVYDQFDYEMEGVDVTWGISGVGSFSGTPESQTDANGQADAVITSSLPGTSMVTCTVTDTEISDTATKDWINIEVDIEKYVKDNSGEWQDADSATGPYIPNTQDPVIFKFTIHNAGGVDLTGVDLTDTDMPTFYTDEACTIVASFPTTLAVDETKTYYGELAWLAGQQYDEATVDGTPPVGSDISDSDPAYYYGSQPSIDVEKYVKDNSGTWQDADSATGPYIPNTQDPVIFKFTIHNAGNVDLTDVDLTDTDVATFYTDEACTEEATFSTTLAVDETKTYYGELDWLAGQQDDEATVDGTPPVGSDISDSDLAYYYGSQPSIDVEKYVKDNEGTWQDADSATGPYISHKQDPVIFKFTIHNTGNVALTGVDLTDTDMSTFYTDEACTIVASFPTTLAVDETKIYYGKLAWAKKQQDDTATAVGTPPVGSDVSDSDLAYYYGRG